MKSSQSALRHSDVMISEKQETHHRTPVGYESMCEEFAGHIGVCFAKGYRASGIASGIKRSGKPDFALVVSDSPAVATGVFTSNVVKAAPVLVSMERLMRGVAQAIVVTSGNANAATGEPGMSAARAICDATADALLCSSELVLIAQTGLIGKPFPKEKGIAGASIAAAQLATDGGERAARAMLTTDTFCKFAHATVQLPTGTIRIGGMAKGAAMLSPSMATMIAVLTTDAAVDRPVLDTALRAALEDSFHSVIVDGCRSTNDTVLLLANGKSGTSKISSLKGVEYSQFAAAVAEVCRNLAKQMAMDAEGATKLLTVNISGARSREDARAAARAVASSVLVKCSLAGESAYWGRVLSEIGASGAQFDPTDVEIAYGDTVVCRQGAPAMHNVASVLKYMKQREIVIDARIGKGPGFATTYGCDLTHEYIDENMGHS